MRFLLRTHSENLRLLLLGFLLLQMLGCDRSGDETGAKSAEVSASEDRRHRPKNPPAPIEDGSRYFADGKDSGRPESTTDARGPASIGTLSITALSPEANADNATLHIGSLVPSLEGLQVVVGENPANAVPGSLLLVHFWEPWNVLSRQSVFLLSRLQREFPQQIQVLHVTAGDAQTVTEFLNERTPPLGRSHRDSVAGTFATDPDRRLALAWKLPKSTVALPTVYLANAEGILQWSGPGLRIERPLRAVLEGTWNLESAAVATNALKELEWRILQNTTRGVPSKARQLLQETPEDPEVAMILLDLLLAEEKYGELEEVAARALEICGNNVDALNRLAWMIVAASESPRVPLQTALQAASKAVMLSGRRPETLETLARVHFRRRSIREAIEIQQEAIAGAATERRALQEAILREYQQAGR